MTKSYKVFYFEDDKGKGLEMQRLLEKTPERPGEPLLEVSYQSSAKIAFGVIKERAGFPPDVALLDVHQANYAGAGLDISDDIKATWPAVPVVMLSDLEELAEQMAGYKHGASTYLLGSIRAQPDHVEFVRTVLLTQIWNAERANTRQSPYWNGSLKVDKKAYKVYWSEKQVNLNPNHVDIVDALANPKQEGGLCGYPELIEKGRINSSKNEEMKDEEDEKTQTNRLRNNLSKHIEAIRDAFAEVDENFKTAGYGIIAVPGKGYRWQTDTD